MAIEFTDPDSKIFSVREVEGSTSTREVSVAAGDEHELRVFLSEGNMVQFEFSSDSKGVFYNGIFSARSSDNEAKTTRTAELETQILPAAELTSSYSGKYTAAKPGMLVLRWTSATAFTIRYQATVTKPNKDLPASFRYTGGPIGLKDDKSGSEFRAKLADERLTTWRRTAGNTQKAPAAAARGGGGGGGGRLLAACLALSSALYCGRGSLPSVKLEAAGGRVTGIRVDVSAGRAGSSSDTPGRRAAAAAAEERSFGKSPLRVILVTDPPSR